MPDDVDTLFPADQKGDVDALFPASLEQQRQSGVVRSPIQDMIFGDTSVNPVARVLDAFGQGAKQNWGAAKLGISDETADYLKKAGVFNDYEKGQTGIIKAANEALIRPAVTSLDALYRGSAAVLGGAQAAGAQLSEELPKEYPGLPPRMAAIARNVPGLIREAVSFPEAFPTGHEFAGVPHLPAELATAKSLGVIGEGEAGWKGTVPRVPQSGSADVVKTAAEQQEQMPGQPAEPSPTAAAPEAAPTEAPAPDIHAVARQIAPETFQEYDTLAQRKDTFRRWIDELRATRDQDAQTSAPHADEIAELQTKIPDATPRLAKKYQARLEPLIAERDAYIEQKTVGDTADMTKIRQQLMATDYRMRDLAPQVSDAYRQAAERVPQPEAEAVPETPATVPATEAAPEPVAAPVAEQEAKPAEPTPAPVEPKTAAPQLPFVPSPTIAQDVAQKLTAAGRPADEAQAASQLVAAYWQTRAERFEGRKGTAEQMYAAEGPEIKAGKERAAAEPAMAQGKQGRIRLRDDGRSTITLLKTADASTFIHETGHEWLDRMLRDAKDGEAPEGLKTDASTVLKWLGADSADALKTRHHEKFARGFETYMMEGRAPSQALANVFAKFKDWLTRIYQTVTALKAPISDDIRDVFDRLLSANPERTTVAPERPVEASYADKHEAIAEEAKPTESHEKAVTVRTERDTKAPENLLEDENNARLADARKGVAEHPPGGAEPPGAANAPEPVSAEAGGPERHGAVGEGGSETPVEGVGPREEPAEPVAPSDPFPRSETRLLDKAGNIRLDKLETGEDVKNVIREAAKDLAPFDVAITRGRISDADVLALSEALGMSPDKLNLRKLGEAFNAEQITAARSLLVKSAVAVKEAAANVTDDASALAYAEVRARHLMIQEQVSGITAEAGRALRAFRQTAGSKEAGDISAFLKNTQGGKTLYQIKEEAKLLSLMGDPGQVSKAIHDANLTLWQRIRAGILSWFINNLISGPITHGAYSVGNSVTQLFKATVTTSVAAALDTLRGASVEDRVHFGEVGAQLYGMVRGMRDGYGPAVTAMKTGISFMKGDPESIAPMGEAALRPQAIPGPIGYAIETPSRMVSAIHTMHYSMNYEAEIARRAFRSAMKDGLDPGTDAFNNKIAEFTQSPPEAEMQAAHDEAMKMVLMKGSTFGTAQYHLQKAVNSNILAKIVMPFMQIGTNILREGYIEHSPLGLLSSGVRDNLMGRNGEAARSMQAAKMGVGIGISTAVLGLTAEGLITGGGPSDRKQLAVLEMTGWKPYSIKVGEFYVPYRKYLGYLGPLVAGVSDMYAVGHALSDEGLTKAAAGAVFGFAEVIADESWARGLANFIDAARHWDRDGGKYLRDLGADFIPFSIGLRQIATMTDPYRREVHSAMDELKSHVPFMSRDLYPVRDIWGNEIASSTMLSPSRVQNDPATKALLDTGYYPARLERNIVGVPLTDQQYDDLSRIAGRMAHMRVAAAAAIPGFTQMPIEKRMDMLKTAVEGARETTREIIKMQNHSIIAQANAAKLAPLRKPATVH